MAIPESSPEVTRDPNRDLPLPSSLALDEAGAETMTLINPGGVTMEPARAEPVSAMDRLAAVDTLRGFALLGILAMNIVAFAWPFSAYENPNLGAVGSLTANRASWMVNQVLFSGKMMSLFSMLFGAGLVLMSDRAAARGASIRGIYYRRVGWLIVFGLIHGYLIWTGDILFAYGLCGLILFLFRHKTPRTLITLGSVLIVFSVLTMGAMGLGIGFLRDMAEKAEAAQAAGETLDPGQEGLVKGWKGAREMFEPTEEQFAKQVEAYRGSFLEILPHRAGETIGFQLFYLPLFGIWGIGGRMLLGMGLMKLGVFSASRSRAFYQRMALIGYGIGMPLTVGGALWAWSGGFDAVADMTRGQILLGLGMVPVALGHAALVMLAVQGRIFDGLLNRLAAVGRMALSNYLAQSLICTTIFYGYGLNQFGRFDRTTLWLVVISVWAVQLWYSPIWLRHFRYGPAEWLWRSLTYGKLQPIRYV